VRKFLLRKEIIMSESNWEMIELYNHSSTTLITTERLKVFNGWMVRSALTAVKNGYPTSCESSIFVPDPNYKWELPK
jgi:hypothetical protein